MSTATVEVFTDVDMLKLGQRLYAARLECGLTQETVAWRANMTPNHYGLIERGLAKGMRVHALHALCHVLRVDPNYVLGFVPHAPEWSPQLACPPAGESRLSPRVAPHR